MSTSPTTRVVIPNTTTAPISPPTLHRNQKNQSKPPAKPGGGVGRKLTHFLCFPLITPHSKPQLQISLRRFRDVVTSPTAPETSKEGWQGMIPSDAIRPVGCLHLTIGVMALDERDEQVGGGGEGGSEKEEEGSKRTLERAIKLLQGLDLEGMLREAGQEATTQRRSRVEARGSERQEPLSSEDKESGATQSLSISLRGAHTFKSSTKASVLYANPVDSTSRLYPFARAILSRFVAEGFIQSDSKTNQDPDLVLHATIVNTTYAKKAMGIQSKGRYRGRGGRDLDMSEVMAIFNERAGHTEDVFDAESPEFVWADGIVIDRVAIFEMGAKKVDGEVLEQEYLKLAEKKIL